MDKKPQSHAPKENENYNNEMKNRTCTNLHHPTVTYIKGIIKSHRGQIHH